jgi:indolepyruvate ferredoxin oxidoreductase alpha subunit
MERSFKEEVEKLKLADGEVFHGEAILAVTKALLQSGVSYVGGYQGAPVSHVMDVLNDARGILDELGVHVETNANEAGAAAMLGASINYPMRGAVAFKSTVGTNVASDALSNLASAGVKGGAMIVLGEDYGEGASIIQERSHAFAMKSQIWLLDPRPEPAEDRRDGRAGLRALRSLEHAGDAGAANPRLPRARQLQDEEEPGAEAFQEGVHREPGLRLRPHLPAAGDLRAGEAQDRRTLARGRGVHPRAQAERVLRRGNAGPRHHLPGRDVQRDHPRPADARASPTPSVRRKVPIYCMNVTYPTIPEEIVEFARSKKSILIVEEGQPAYIEEQVLATLRRHEVNDVKVRGKDVLPMAGEYTGEVVLTGIARFMDRENSLNSMQALKQKAAELLGGLPVRPPGFCVGCPERPVFSAMKILEKDTGKFHMSADIGCHLFSTLPPVQHGQHRARLRAWASPRTPAVEPMFAKRTVTMMGDGGFWHNGLTTGIANTVFNKNDGVLVIMKNGYSSATGTQELPVLAAAQRHPRART